jgi:hypothetical protein
MFELDSWWGWSIYYEGEMVHVIYSEKGGVQEVDEVNNGRYDALESSLHSFPSKFRAASAFFLTNAVVKKECTFHSCIQTPDWDSTSLSRSNKRPS